MELYLEKIIKQTIKNKNMKAIDKDYKIIPMDEISDEAREIAVRWGTNMKDNFISQKQKLASDIMNYARRYHEQEVKNDKSNKSIDMAEQQLLGFYSRQNGSTLRDIVSSMGLTKTEWETIKTDYAIEYISEDDKHSIDLCFRKTYS